VLMQSLTCHFFVREYINIFMDGFVPTENLWFCDKSLVSKVAKSATEEVKRMNHYDYPGMTKTIGSFQFNCWAGRLSDFEILELFGENVTGKTTFIRILAGNLDPDEGPGNISQLHISYKLQKISQKSEGSVRQLLH
jgi:ATP-binding cassette subfamily E protein 1